MLSGSVVTLPSHLTSESQQTKTRQSAARGPDGTFVTDEAGFRNGRLAPCLQGESESCSADRSRPVLPRAGPVEGGGDRLSGLRRCPASCFRAAPGAGCWHVAYWPCCPAGGGAGWGRRSGGLWESSSSGKPEGFPPADCPLHLLGQWAVEGKPHLWEGGASNPSGQVCSPRTRHWSFVGSLRNFRRASLVAQMLTTLPAMQESGRPLEKGTTTHCSILAWRIPWTEEPGGLSSLGL